MRLLGLELKRMLKSRRTLILIAAALLMSLVMAYVPIAFESINRPNEGGGYTELSGMAAIDYKRIYYASSAGTVTPEKLADALRTYQSFTREYGSAEDIPLPIYIESIMPVRRMLEKVSEAYADPKTGAAAELTDIDPKDVEKHFYERCAEHLNDVMQLEQKDHETARAYAAEKYSEVSMPFWFHYSISRDAFDYIELYIFLLSIICVAIAAPAFAGEYQTGSDSVLRCTKYGYIRLAITRIMAVYGIFIMLFTIGISIELMIINRAFGSDCLETSLQALFSVISLPNINLWQLQVILVLAGLTTVMACTSCALFLSAKCKDPLSVLLISMAILLLPTFAYSALDANWLLTILPSSGVGLKNAFLYQLCDFKFLYIGNSSVWTPYVIMASAAVEIPGFLILAVRSYCRHQVAR